MPAAGAAGDRGGDRSSARRAAAAARVDMGGMGRMGGMSAPELGADLQGVVFEGDGDVAEADFAEGEGAEGDGLLLDFVELRLEETAGQRGRHAAAGELEVRDSQLQRVV